MKTIFNAVHKPLKRPRFVSVYGWWGSEEKVVYSTYGTRKDRDFYEQRDRDSEYRKKFPVLYRVNVRPL